MYPAVYLHLYCTPLLCSRLHSQFHISDEFFPPQVIFQDDFKGDVRLALSTALMESTVHFRQITGRINEIVRARTFECWQVRICAATSCRACSVCKTLG